MADLRTPRLFLEPLRADDLPALHIHWTEPEVRRYLWDGRVISSDQVRDILHTSEQLFSEHHAGLWVVRPLGASTLIGCSGFWYFHEPPELELILSLSHSCWGQGVSGDSTAYFPHT
jgi:ribosomal-protein-alanine N-acetyltransferase